MFDLDAIEKDWKENSFCLSDEEIRKIYIEEGVTIDAYYAAVEECEKNKPKFEGKVDTSQRILWSLFGDTEKEKEYRRKAQEYEKKLKEYYAKNDPKKPRLSMESQKKVVEGSMDIVFFLTRSWYERLNRVISLEELYYLSLDTLLNAAKYCVHYDTKNCFRSYVKTCMDKNIIKFLAKKEHISYRNAYCIFSDTMHWPENKKLYKVKKFSFDYDKEIPYKPSSIYEMTKDEYEEPDYTKEISSEEFMKDYTDALKELSEDEYRIMTLAYTKDGFPGLTHNEISDYLGIESKDITNAKRRVKKRLNNDLRFNKYKD